MSLVDAQWGSPFAPARSWHRDAAKACPSAAPFGRPDADRPNLPHDVSSGLGLLLALHERQTERTPVVCVASP